jgi:hypothetical protein
MQQQRIERMRSAFVLAMRHNVLGLRSELLLEEDAKIVQSVTPVYKLPRDQAPG